MEPVISFERKNSSLTEIVVGYNENNIDDNHLQPDLELDTHNNIDNMNNVINNNNKDRSNSEDDEDEEIEINLNEKESNSNNKEEKEDKEDNLQDIKDIKEIEDKVQQLQDDFITFNFNEPHTGLIIHDNYGFLIDQEMVQSHIIYRDKFTRLETMRKAQWLDLIEENPTAFQDLSIPFDQYHHTNSPHQTSHPTHTQRLQEAPKPFKEMIRKGVPSEFRAIVWLRCSGAYTRLSKNPDEYYNLLNTYKGKKSIATKQIEMDVDRTFPDHKYLNTPEHMEKLTNVLTAYSWRNPKLGYCQCMNFIAGYLLIYMSEHEAYWTLVSIIEDILPGEYFTSTMIDLSVDIRFVFDDLLQKKLPRLHKHFTSFGLSLPLIISKWFLCIMTTTTPTETTFRIWDVFFSEGSKVMFRFGIALFKMNEEKLLTCKDYNTLYSLIKKIPSHAYDADALMDVAFNKLGSFPMSKIDQRRKESKVIVTAEFINFQLQRHGINNAANRKQQQQLNSNNNNNNKKVVD